MCVSIMHKQLSKMFIYEYVFIELFPVKNKAEHIYLNESEKYIQKRRNEYSGT